MNEREFNNYLVEACKLDPEKPVLVGFSGGPDSTCLLHRLWCMGFQVIAAHLDHGLRPGSSREADYVGQLCAQWGIRLVSQTMDVRAYSEERRISIEEAAREVRYRFLFDMAKQAGAQAVLVAHHADDQVETVLMHFLRGSGTSGLAGMRLRLQPNPWSTSIPLVRPLLTTWRQEIEEYCRQHEIAPLQDESNADTTYFRNRIRAELIPQLQTYNPGIKDRLLRTAEVTGGDESFLQQETGKAWLDCLESESQEYILLDRSKWLALHPALQRRLARMAIGRLNATLRDIDFTVIDRLLHFLQSPTRSNSIELLSGLQACLYMRQGVLISRGGAKLDTLWPRLEADEVQIPLPGKVEFSENWVILGEYSQDLVPQGGEWSCLLDADQVTGALRLRKFAPGDRFEPLGMAGKVVKLGDFWTEAGLPVSARRFWPLLVDDLHILWVPGFRLSHAARIREGTRRAIRLQLKKI